VVAEVGREVRVVDMGGSWLVEWNDVPVT
jgi:hypothetical protein